MWRAVRHDRTDACRERTKRLPMTVVLPIKERPATHGQSSTRRLPVHLGRLESEAIEIMREVVAEFKNPVMLYSIGKDSSVILHLGAQSLLSGTLAISFAACRHHVEVPRNDLLSRRDGAPAWSKFAGLREPGWGQAGHQPDRIWFGNPHARDEDRSTQTSARQIRIRCGVLRRAA